MSNYLSTGAIDIDVRSKIGHKDFIKLKMHLKNAMMKHMGEIPVKSPSGFVQKYPNMSYNDAANLIVYWRKLGDEAWKYIMKPSTSVPGGPIDRAKRAKTVKDALNRFNTQANYWLGRWVAPDLNSPRFLSPEGNQQFWSNLLSTYVIELDNATWSAFNLPAYDIAFDGMVETAKNLGRGVSNGLKAAIETAKSTMGLIPKLIKIGFYGGIAFGGYWLYNKAKNR